jgi:hypothetical protein
MKRKQDAREGLGFLDGFLARFRRAPAAPEPEKTTGPSPEALRQQFDAALKGLTEKIEEQRRQEEEAGLAAARSEKTPEELAAERAQRMGAAHQGIREDVVAVHARLGTGLRNEDLTDLRAYLEEVGAVVAAGARSHELLPRARYAIATRLDREAARLALVRLREVLEAASVPWPDPIGHHPSATKEMIENARKRRFAEMREQFLAWGLTRTADRTVGIVGAWGADYPERASPLWEEAVLEAVAAGLRAQLVREFVEQLRGDRETIVAAIERLLGPELAAIQKVLESRVASVEEATQAAAGVLRVVDEVIPDLAWKHLCSVLPQARGE